jgi:AcrR family transcriptional regulator
LSPRGVAIPGVREQLFQAADRLLASAGPAALTTRAITSEAGVANGVLHRHFHDLDTFLAEFAADRLQAIADSAAALPSRAGHGTVTGNLTDATLALFGSSALALVNLVAARPALATALEHVSTAGSGLGDVEKYFAAYLEAEKELGRIAADTDTQTLAFALLGSVHHLMMTNPAGLPDLPHSVRRIVEALAAGMRPDPG